jgi:hypothetical protein
MVGLLDAFDEAALTAGFAESISEVGWVSSGTVGTHYPRQGTQKKLCLPVNLRSLVPMRFIGDYRLKQDLEQFYE